MWTPSGPRPSPKKAWHKGLEECKDAENKLAFARAMLNMDLTKDVHGITFYGSQIGKRKGVAIVSAALDPDRILGLTAALPGRETTKYGDHEINSWTRKRHEHTWTVAAAFRGTDQLVVGDSVDSVKAALDVLGGKSPGLTGDSALAGHIPDGTTFLARAQGIAAADLPCKVPVVKQIDSYRLVTGESGGQSFFRARITMTNPEAAAQGLTILQGWKAQSTLLCPDELVHKMTAGLNPKAEDKNLTILWSASADDVWVGVQKLEKIIKKHHARHKHQHDKGASKPDKPRGDGKKPASPDEDF